MYNLPQAEWQQVWSRTTDGNTPVFVFIYFLDLFLISVVVTNLEHCLCVCVWKELFSYI